MDSGIFDTEVSRRKFLKALALAGVVSSVDILGPWDKRVFGKEKPIKIGHPDPLTGPYASLGSCGVWGATVAVDRINKAGGINGRPVELIAEDTQGQVPMALRKIRKLLTKNKVDVLQGLTSSAVCLGSMPTAKEFKTLFMTGICMATDITREKADRYTFRPYNNATIQAVAFGPWLVKNVGKKWQFAYADYAWGQSEFKEFAISIKAAGGEILGGIPIPHPTEDMLPYLSKVNPKADGLHLSFAGHGAVIAVTQAGELGLNKKMGIAGPGAIIAASDLPAMGDASNGVMSINRYPPVIEGPLDTPFNRAFHEEYLKVSKGNVANRYSVSNFEGINFIKLAMEQVNYQDKEKDTCKVIEALEGMKVKEGPDFPQGDKFMRADDHQVFCRQFICQAENQKIKVLGFVPLEDGMYPPAINLTKRPC
jgi:branched-chain amino acid transport system substrate-binding protein